MNDTSFDAPETRERAETVATTVIVTGDVPHVFMALSGIVKLVFSVVANCVPFLRMLYRTVPVAPDSTDAVQDAVTVLPDAALNLRFDGAVREAVRTTVA